MSARCLALLSLTLFATFAADARLKAQAPGGGAADAEITTAPVVLDGTVLFHVRGVSSFPAETRARLIRDRVAAAAADPNISVESFRAVDSGGVTHILAGALPVATIVEADASLEQVGRNELAAVALAKIKQAVVDYRAARAPGTMRRAATSAVAATLILAATTVALFWGWRRVNGFLMRRLQGRIQSVQIQSFELMRPEMIWSAARSALLALRTLALLAAGLVYLGFVLRQFPWTRGLSNNMVALALGPLEVMGRGIVAHIPSLVFLTVLFFAVRLGLRLIRAFFDAVGRGAVTLSGFDREWADPTYKIVRIAVVAFSLIVAYPYIPGSNTAAFQGVSLFVGIIFSLGSTSAISNIIAGYMMTYRRALKVGDRVKIGDSVGEVIETRIQVTHLRSLKNEEIIIPNSQIIAGEVLNYSSLAPAYGLILHTEVGIGYETPWRQVEAMLLSAADRTSQLSKEPPPFVLEKRLGDFAVVYELNAYCSSPQGMNRIYAELHRNILDVFNEHRVQIMTPAYEGDPSQPKIVPPEEWYAAPAERERAGGRIVQSIPNSR